MKIVFSLHGTKGDIFPFVPIAYELRFRGHEIVFLVNEYFREDIEAAGFEVYPTGTRAQFVEFHSDQRIWSLKQDSTEIGFKKILRPTIEASFEYIENQTEKPAVLGIEPLFNGALMAAEKFDLPNIYAFLWPHVVISAFSPSAPSKWRMPGWLTYNMRVGYTRKALASHRKHLELKDYFWELNGVRRTYGLDPVEDLSSRQYFTKPNLQIGLFPSWYGSPVFDWPQTLQLTGFPLTKETPSNLDHTIEDFIEKHGKPILFTSGTGVFDTENITGEGQKACEELDVSGIFVGGDKHLGKKITSPKCLHIDYVEFDDIFPKCCAIVHHGGIGTLSKAVRAGVPQLIRPLSFDQPDNADRVRRLNLGDYILPKNFKARRVAPILKRLIGDEKIKSSIAHFRSVMSRDNPIMKTSDLVEGYLETATPNYKIPIRAAVEELHAGKTQTTISNIPLTNRRSKKTNGDHEALAMILSHFDKTINLKDLHRKFLSMIPLGDMIGEIREAGLGARPLSCEAQYLTQLKLPCLIYWQTSRFVLLLGFDKDEAVILDPVLMRQRYTLAELAWNYSEVAIEVSQPR